jgi:diguanylate cyclase
MSDELLGRISETIATARTTEELTRPLLTMLELVTGLESTYLTRVDEQAGVQSILYARNTQAMQIPEGLSVPWDDTLCKRALEEGRMITEDVAGCWGDSEAARALGIQTYASTPVCNADGSLFGTLCAASASRHPVSPEGRQILTMFGMLIQQHIQREHLLERLTEANRKLERYSFTDPLTGLANRRFILQELHRLFEIGRRTGRVALVAFIDLDGFKAINDTMGHDTGDEFLVEVGRRLGEGLRASDVLGRLGGDEFVVVGLGSARGSDEDVMIDAMRARLAPLLHGRFTLDSASFEYGGASIGVTAVDPDECGPDEALRRADAAMYRDKQLRRALGSATGAGRAKKRA